MTIFLCFVSYLNLALLIFVNITNSYIYKLFSSNIYMEKIRQYIAYLDEEIEGHRASARLESLAGELAEERCAFVLHQSRDKLYELFPELRPAGYKTALESGR